MTREERDALLTRLDERTERLDQSRIDQETRIRSLEKKWWTTLGAAFLSLLAFFKSIFT